MDETSTKGKRTRRSSDHIRSEKIAALEEKIAKKEQELAGLRSSWRS